MKQVENKICRFVISSSEVALVDYKFIVLFDLADVNTDVEELPVWVCTSEEFKVGVVNVVVICCFVVEDWTV